MTTEITFSNLFWNDELRGFFFREQSEATFNEVMARILDNPESEAMMDDFIESRFSTIDEMEEYFYEEDAETIIAELSEYCQLDVAELC